MIPNVVKGADMSGLIRYLVGPGRASENGNVHVDPHVIAGDGFLQTWYGTEMLEASSVPGIVAYLERPRELYGTEIQTATSAQDPESGERVATGYTAQHVWHCSLSLKADEGPLADGKWEEIASDFMDSMGFTEASGKAPCRWVGIHHGPSKDGNDHIHIAASMVREDGTRWEGRYRDYQRAQQVCRELEVAHGLHQIQGRGEGLAERGERPAERRQAAAAGLRQTAPKELAERIRVAAVGSTSEAEWIRRVRADGVVVKPFYAKGGTDVVAGYRAALKPSQYNEKLAFYGGGQVGTDLSLPRLREAWPPASVESAEAASAEWRAAARGLSPTTHKGRETRGLVEGAQDVAAANLGKYNDQLRMIPVSDRAAWADAARDTAGILAAWARVDPENAPQLRAAASAMSRSAQLRRAPLPAGRRVKESPMGTALILLSTAPGATNTIAGAVFMRQILKTATAVRDHHQAAARAGEAQQVQRQVIDRLQAIQLIGYRTPGTAAESKDSAAERTPAAAGVETRAEEARRLSRVLNPHAGRPASPIPRPLQQPGPQRYTAPGPVVPSKKGTERDGRD